MMNEEMSSSDVWDKFNLDNMYEAIKEKINEDMKEYDKAEDKNKKIYEVLCIMNYMNSSIIPILIEMSKTLIELSVLKGGLKKLPEEDKKESKPSYIR